MGSTRNPPSYGFRKLKKRNQDWSVYANQAHNLHPTFVEVCRQKMLSISSDLHPHQMLKESNQILMRIMLITNTTIPAMASNINYFTPDHGRGTLSLTYATSMDARCSGSIQFAHMISERAHQRIVEEGVTSYVF